MSGYELHRFVDLSQSETEEYTCSICHDIFCNPVVTNCCLQTFCEQCINEWLETNSTCPYDRKPIDRSQLSNAPRMITNMLGKMKIRCIYDKNGCKEVLLLDNLENHQKSCRFDKTFCDKCFFRQSTDHNCVERLLECKRELLENNNKLQEELKLASDEISSFKSEKESYHQLIQELTDYLEEKTLNNTSNETSDQNELKLAMDKISLLESEIKNYLQTIQKLSKPYEPKAVSRNANELSQNSSDKEILSEARKYLDSPIIGTVGTNKILANRIRFIAKNALIYENSLQDLSQYVQETLQSEFDEIYFCNAFISDDDNELHQHFVTTNSVNLKFGNLLIKIYKICDQ